jgi:hypothetical protein
MRRIGIVAAAVVSLLGATAEAQQLPKSGKYKGTYED